MPGKPRPAPPIVAGESLSLSRRRGADFDAAWLVAMGAVRDVLEGRKREPRLEWLDVMEATKGEWQAAYENRMTATAHLFAVHEDDLADRLSEVLRYGAEVTT